MMIIYKLTDPTGALSCYVGATSLTLDKRLVCHVSDARRRNSPKDRWVRTLLAQGLKPTMTELKTVSEDEVVQAEAEAIAEARAVCGADCLNTNPSDDNSRAGRLGGLAVGEKNSGCADQRR